MLLLNKEECLKGEHHGIIGTEGTPTEELPRLAQVACVGTDLC